MSTIPPFLIPYQKPFPDNKKWFRLMSQLLPHLLLLLPLFSGIDILDLVYADDACVFTGSGTDT